MMFWTRLSRDRRRRSSLLADQIDTELRPVLKRKDFEEFELGRAFDTVAKIASKLGATE